MPKVMDTEHVDVLKHRWHFEAKIIKADSAYWQSLMLLMGIV